MRVVVAQEPSVSAEAVRKVLLGLGLECGVADCVPPAELGVRLAQAPADLVLVRLSGDRATALAAIRQASALTRAPLLALAPAADANQSAEATRGGAREVLDEARLEEDLHAALARLNQAGALNYGQGMVVSVLSATPGSGVTTVAANVAFTWGAKYPGQVALVEMGQEAADLALNLDLEPAHTITDVTQQWQRMDVALLRQSVAIHPEGVCVLAHKPETLTVGSIEPAAVRKALVLMRMMFRRSVLDLGHTFAEEHYEAMRLSDRVAVVVRLDIPALRQARRLLKQCVEEHGVAADRVRLVANRYGQKGQLSWKKAEEALGYRFHEYVPDDVGKLNAALNRGQPVVCAAPRSGIARRFGKLAVQLNGQQ